MKYWYAFCILLTYILHFHICQCLQTVLMSYFLNVKHSNSIVHLFGLHNELLSSCFNLLWWKIDLICPRNTNFSDKDLNSCYYNSWARSFLLESDFLAIWEEERGDGVFQIQRPCFWYHEHRVLLGHFYQHWNWASSVTPSGPKWHAQAHPLGELADPGHETD